MTRMCGALVAVCLFTGAPLTHAEPSFAFVVEEDKTFGSTAGRLVFDADGVRFDSTDGETRRTWTYENVKQIQVLASTRFAIKTYEDQGRLKLGADRTFSYQVTDGTIPVELVSFLLGRVEQPLVAAVVPVAIDKPPFVVPVKLRGRLKGSHGVLALHGDRLVYDAATDGAARVWRPIDLHAVFQPDRHRLTIDAYEGGGDAIRTFSFELKRPLPTGFLDAMWDLVFAVEGAGAAR